MNFEQATTYCLQKNSFIVTPKSLAEQRVLTILNNTLIWVNSTISYLGEPFLWPDGSKVRTFRQGEPENSNSGFYTLNDDAAIYQNFEFYDFKASWNSVYAACQIIN